MKRSAILVCAFICARIPVAAQINYSFTNIDVPGATQTNPSGVNASGEVAGYYWDGSTDHGFVYINGQFTTFDYPGALLTQALSVADNGDVYGAYALAGSWQAFKYTPNTAQFETLPLPIQLQQNVQIITGVGPTGDVVGHMENPQTGFYGAFLVSNGQLTIVPARSSTSYLGTTAVGVNGSGQVLASSWDLSDAYVYSRGVLTTVPSMNPGGIGPQGQIVGQAKDSPSSGVVFADGVLSTFQAPGSTSASFNQSIRPYGINVSNQIVGTYVDTSGIQHGFLATPPSPVQGETTKGYVDTPNGNSGSLSGIVPVIGWAIDNKAAIADVNILVDNTWVGVAKLGMSRTDVCAAFPNQVNCPNVGWTYQLDTTQLADGPHVITALATSANIAHAIVTTPITVANSGAKARNPLRLWIDVPGPQNSTFSGEATFAGWAGDDTAPVNSITALVDHTATFY
ncbi:MAG: hypothetical protein JO061_11905, partial [Acidobacteriaceae bacterium]|nr:hypothetical protein [Acidobacteriaceae bacterium]